MNLALDGLPEFTCLPGEGEHLRGAISFSPSIDYMELAYDDAKSGRFSRRPYIDMVIPTLVDPSMAPPGKHVMSCFVQYAPYHLADGDEWDDARRDAFGETVVDTIAERAPNIRELILHAQVLTPKDIEDRFGLSEGNIFQGELSLEQLFFNRPVAGLGPLPDAAAEPLDVRLGHAPRGRDHGGVGTSRRAPGRALAPQPARRPEAVARERYDAVIVGAGHNGLVTAGYLAKAGLRTLVLERREPGGRRPGHRGGRARVCARRLRPTASEVFVPDVVRDLGLGVARLPSRSSRRWSAFAPSADGPGLTLWRDPVRTATELRTGPAA